MSFLFWRYRPDLNWRMRVLQTLALPLGHGTIWNKERIAFLVLERVTRLELATSTLARWRSTGWATPANLVPPVGIGPTPRGFSVHCSTNWATKAYRKKKWRPGTGSNRRPLAWQASVLTCRTPGPPFGGNNRARTCDPLLVRQMLSQLSYAPLTLAAPIIYQIQTQMSILFFKFF